MKLAQHGFLILLEVIITFGFLTVFFFTYVSHVEEEQVNKQIENVVQDLVKKMNVFLLPLSVTEQERIRSQLRQHVTEQLEQLPAPEKSSKKNALLQSRGILYLGFFFISITALSFAMNALKLKFQWQDILHYAILAVVVAALVEFLFLRLIATQYISIDGDTVLNLFGKELTS